MAFREEPCYPPGAVAVDVWAERYSAAGRRLAEDWLMPESDPSYLRPGAIGRIFGHALAFLVWIGLIRGHFYVLEVRGRKTGKTLSLPVDPLDLDGRRYLVCARGNSNWVRNARAAGEVVLGRAMRRHHYAVRELPPASVHRFSKLISTVSPAKFSASSPCRRVRR